MPMQAPEGGGRGGVIEGFDERKRQGDAKKGGQVAEDAPHQETKDSARRTAGREDEGKVAGGARRMPGSAEEERCDENEQKAIPGITEHDPEGEDKHRCQEECGSILPYAGIPNMAVRNP